MDATESGNAVNKVVGRLLGIDWLQYWYSHRFMAVWIDITVGAVSG
jgi:hypothetical protein